MVAPAVRNILNAPLTLPSGYPLLSPSMRGMVVVVARMAASRDHLRDLSTLGVWQEMDAAGYKVMAPKVVEGNSKRGYHRLQGGTIPVLAKKLKARTGVSIRDHRHGWVPQRVLVALGERALEEGKLDAVDWPALRNGFGFWPDDLRTPDLPAVESVQTRSLQITPEARSPNTSNHTTLTVLGSNSLLSTTTKQRAEGDVSPSYSPSAYLPSREQKSERRSRRRSPLRKGRRRDFASLEGDALTAFNELLATTAHLPEKHRDKFRRHVAYDLATFHPLETVLYAIRRSNGPGTRETSRLINYLLSRVLGPFEAVETSDPEELQRWWAAETASRKAGTPWSHRNEAWRLILEEMSITMEPRLGQAEWKQLENVYYLGFLREKTPIDYIQCETREQRDRWEELAEEISYAARRICSDPLRKHSDRLGQVANFNPVFVVRAKSPEENVAATTEETNEEALPPGLPEKWAPAYRALRGSGVIPDQAEILVRHSDLHRIGLVIREGRSRPEIRCLAGFVTKALQRFDELSFEDAMKVELLLEQGVRCDVIREILPVRQFSLAVLQARVLQGYDFQRTKKIEPGTQPLGGWLKLTLLGPKGAEKLPEGEDKVPETLLQAAKERAEGRCARRRRELEEHRDIRPTKKPSVEDVVDREELPAEEETGRTPAIYEELEHLTDEERELIRQIAEFTTKPQDRDGVGDRERALRLLRTWDDRELLERNLAACRRLGPRAGGGLLIWAMRKGVDLSVKPSKPASRRPKRGKRDRPSGLKEALHEAMGEAFPVPPAGGDAVPEDLPEELANQLVGFDVKVQKRWHRAWTGSVLSSIVDRTEIAQLRDIRYAGQTKDGRACIYAGSLMYGCGFFTRYHHVLRNAARREGLRLTAAFWYRDTNMVDELRLVPLLEAKSGRNPSD